MERFDYLRREAAPAFDRLYAYGVGGFPRLCERDRTILAVASVLAQVASGGFIGFYSNPCGDWAGETVEALERIGADEAARTLLSLNDEFPNGRPSPNRAERQNQIAALREGGGFDRRWGLRSQDFCAMTDEIEERLYQYLTRTA